MQKIVLRWLILTLIRGGILSYDQVLDGLGTAALEWLGMKRP